jgi:hypothetical protein
MTSDTKFQQPATGFQPLLTERTLRIALGGMSERKFKELRAAGVIPDPLELGPRQPRWTHDDYLEILCRLPRRPIRQEPEALAEGRRARIESIKAATTAAA